ncbi:MurR/RpiR family transcriptional regulator [Lysobacter niastensis]|uniref:MurR/RpiR family transcriptional regulator n=1 Tax=Lysobacter niastensis TaxID=380629 RepID=A0ABS0B860_9GAMM|nr:MurR/RpiR family transcriptional regulator [Lysobacter niastensis]MBF6025022.1 MurR/RpiR family transcriptional regulator [Lysobacter niastensis]
MSPLLKIRAERDQMSAIERRIADFLLDNAHLLRDYSSQQLANALGISQSSVVKFSQKLGFKGYPDLKYSIGEAVARGNGGDEGGVVAAAAEDPRTAQAEQLWQLKAQAEAETRLINPTDRIDAIASALQQAGKVYIIGLGEDGIPARAFATRLSMLGIVTVHYVDAILMQAGVSSAAPGDVLLVFSEHGRQPELCQIGRRFRERSGKVVTVTRHTPNPLRAYADASLLVSAHDGRRHIEPLLYQSALQHLLDLIYVLLCDGNEGRRRQFDLNLELMHDLLDS